jgi:hypothetical protein
LNWLWRELQVVFQQISSIGYGFRDKTWCSKTDAERSPYRIAAVVSVPDVALYYITIYMLSYHFFLFDSDCVVIVALIIVYVALTAYLKAKYINWMLRIIYCRNRNINLSTTKVYFLFSEFIQHMYISKLFNCQHGLKLKPKQTCLMCGPKKTVIGFFIKYAVLHLKINLLPIGIPIYIYLHLYI